MLNLSKYLMISYSSSDNINEGEFKTQDDLVFPTTLGEKKSFKPHLMPMYF